MRSWKPPARDCQTNIKSSLTSSAGQHQTHYHHHEMLITSWISRGTPQRLGYSPLYEMSTEVLEAAREYIINNLNKVFIVPSQSSYASPISVYYFFFLFVLFMLVTRDSVYAWMHNEVYPI